MGCRKYLEIKIVAKIVAKVNECTRLILEVIEEVN